MLVFCLYNFMCIECINCMFVSNNFSNTIIHGLVFWLGHIYFSILLLVLICVNFLFYIKFNFYKKNLETELVGLPNAEKSQSHFTQCCKRGWVSPPPPLPPFPPETCQVQQILERPSEGGRLRSSADTKLS